MKKVMMFVTIVVFISACSSNEHGINTDNISVVQKYVQAVESKNADAMAALLSDDYMGYVPSFLIPSIKQMLLQTGKMFQRLYMIQSGIHAPSLLQRN